MGSRQDRAIQEYRQAMKERNDAEIVLDTISKQYQEQSNKVKELTEEARKKKENLIKVAGEPDEHYQD